MTQKKPSKADMTMGQLVKHAASTTTPLEIRNVGLPVIPEGKTQICLFKAQEIRQILHNDEWWYSIVDIVGVLSQSTNPSRYWSELKKKLVEESGTSQLFDEIEQLNMPGKDGKLYATDCANTETIFRVLQSVPSPNAEPFKRWLAKTAYERVLEYQNPEIAIKRAIATYKLQGRDDEWIKNRLQTVISRNELTNEWQARGVKEGVQYAALTDTINKETFGKTTAEHKKYKSLSKGHSLRDHMSGLELVLTMLGEEATKEIAVRGDARGFSANRKAAEAGGSAAGEARKAIERQTGQPILSKQNFLKKDTQEKFPQSN